MLDFAIVMRSVPFKTELSVAKVNWQLVTYFVKLKFVKFGQELGGFQIKLSLVKFKNFVASKRLREFVSFLVVNGFLRL